LKLLLDAMLGHLLSWLRILGYDTLYWTSELDDDQLVEEARRDDRIIITRDVKLCHKAQKEGIKCIILKTYDTVEALAHLAETLGIRTEFNEDETRCPECNTLLTKTSIEPKRWLCSGCGKEYWIGGHWKNINRILSEVRRKIGKTKHNTGDKTG